MPKKLMPGQLVRYFDQVLLLTRCVGHGQRWTAAVNPEHRGRWELYVMWEEDRFEGRPALPALETYSLPEHEDRNTRILSDVPDT